MIFTEIQLNYEYSNKLKFFLVQIFYPINDIKENVE